MRIRLLILLLLPLTPLSALDAVFHLNNSAYIYNGENGSYWEETRTTITYLENLLEPRFEFRIGTASFEAGVGLLTPFNQEDKLINWYPVVRSTLQMGQWKLVLGSLYGAHDLPSPILDPLTSLTPQVRVISTSRVPLPYESFPLGLFSHGRYEYGLSLNWDLLFQGELYVNWQLADTANHRERFDMGLIQKIQIGPLPWYGALHYWHNGGHENPHLVAITENYNLAVGLQNTNFSALYLLSYWLPDRETNPGANVLGQALYGRYRHAVGRGFWHLEGEVFVSSELLTTNQRYVSIEGDPFFRMPLYLGLNISYIKKFARDFTLALAFKNGVFWPGPGVAWNGLMIRYDQMIRLDFNTRFDLTPSVPAVQPVILTNLQGVE